MGTVRVKRLSPQQPSDTIVPISQAITGFIQGLQREQSNRLEGLAEEWPALVGGMVAAHARPGVLERGELTVFVDSSVWLSELSRHGRKDMLAALQRRFGSAHITGLRLQLDPEGPRS